MFNRKYMIKKHLGKIIIGLSGLIGFTIGFLTNAKTLIFIIGLFSIMMYFNIMITTLANAFIGRDINPNYDIFWKIFFLLISCISFGVYINL